MKKLYTLFLMSVFALFLADLHGQASLFFSEYIEGSSNNKALEIHNPTDQAVDLKDYQIAQSSNGSGWKFYHIFPDGASIAAGDVWVIITDQTDEALYPSADADEVLGFPSVVHHNGDDARGLIFITDTDTTLIDVIGIPDEDPGAGWVVAGIPDGTKEHTLVRKNHILAGNTDWAASAGTDEVNSEWMVNDQNFFDSLGVHTFMPEVMPEYAPLFFSEYIEGSSNNKAIEVHNPTDSTVQLKNYQIAQSSNGGGWQYYHIFPDGASIDAGDVWAIITDQTDEALYPSADADEVLGYPSVVHHNGDDARGIIYVTDTDTTLIDVIGIPDEDPGSGWEVAGIPDGTKEHTLVRKNHILVGNTDWAGSAGTDADDSEWMVYDQNFFDSLGVHTYIPIVDVATINLTGEGDATTIETDKGSLQIVAEVLPANASNMDLTWSVNDITLASINETGLLTAINDGVVTVTATALDGSGVTGTIDITNSNQTPVVPVSSINVTGAGGETGITENGGSLQMEAEVLPADASDKNYTWSVSDETIATINESGLLQAVNMGTVTVTATADDGFGGMGSLEVTISNQYTEVADLTALKALDPSNTSTVYKVMGEVIVTYTQSYRNKKYVQDAAGGVEIDDNPGAISTAFNVGDGITGLMGTIQEYNGLLQFNPVADPGAASSTENEILPIELTPAELIADHDLYESRVVMLKSVVFLDADGTVTFENGKNYDMADAMDTLTCRTNFYDTDLTGSVIPDSANVTGIVLEFKGSVQLSPRSAADVEELILYVPSDDASISDLLVGEISIPGFTPAQITYYVELPEGTTDVPDVDAVTNNDSAVVTVTDATDLYGTEAERTSTVLITAEDKMTTKTYEVVFSVLVGIGELEGDGFEVYPIPADDFLMVRSTESLQELRIISITGSTVRMKELSGEKNLQLNIGDLESGVYFLKLSGDSSSRILRFVKN